MAELLRFDFSNGGGLDGSAAARSLSYRPLSRSFFHRPGRNSQSVPPAIRLAFLIVVSLTAGACSFAVSKLIAPVPAAVAQENILPAPQSSPKLKSAAVVVADLPDEVLLPIPAPDSDRDMSPLVQLPVDDGFPLPPPLPLVSKPAEVPPARPEVYDPEAAYDPQPVHDPELVYDPRPAPMEPTAVDLLPPDPLPGAVPVAKVKIEAPAFELPPGPPDITVEKTPDPRPIVALPMELPAEVAADDDRIRIYFDSIHHGDTPMLNTWKHLKIAAVLAAALAAGQPAEAQEDIKTVLKQLDSMNLEIKNAFGELNKDIKNLQGNIDNLRLNVTDQGKDVDALKNRTDDLEKTVKQLRMEIDDVRTLLLLSPVTKESFDEVRNRIRFLEDKLAETQSQSSKRIALAPATNTGRIMLVNLYNEDLVFTVNGQTYRVPAGRSTPVENVPVGTVMYEMISPTWGRRANTQTTLVANETLTLTAQ